MIETKNNYACNRINRYIYNTQLLSFHLWQKRWWMKIQGQKILYIYIYMNIILHILCHKWKQANRTTNWNGEKTSSNNESNMSNVIYIYINVIKLWKTKGKHMCHLQPHIKHLQPKSSASINFYRISTSKVMSNVFLATPYQPISVSWRDHLDVKLTQPVRKAQKSANKMASAIFASRGKRNWQRNICDHRVCRLTSPNKGGLRK